jgi:hypothetical protein
MIEYSIPACPGWVLLVICYSLLEYDDGPIRLLAGKPESHNAGMLKERKTSEPPSFPASQLQAY